MFLREFHRAISYKSNAAFAHSDFLSVRGEFLFIYEEFEDRKMIKYVR